MDNNAKRRNTPKKFFECKCGKKYPKNSTLSNHIRLKHENDKTFQINKGERGRPTKESIESQQIKDGFIPQPQEIAKISKINQNDNIQGQLRPLQEKIQTEENKLIKEDEQVFYWYNISNDLFDTIFKQYYLSFKNLQLNRLLKVCYAFSLINNHNQKDLIVKNFIEQCQQILHFQ